MAPNRLMNGSGYTWVSFSTDTYRPVHCFTCAHFRFPHCIHLGQIVGKHVRGTTTIGTVNNSNFFVGELHTGVQLLQSGIIPILDLSQKMEAKTVGASV